MRTRPLRRCDDLYPLRQYPASRGHCQDTRLRPIDSLRRPLPYSPAFPGAHPAASQFSTTSNQPCNIAVSEIRNNASRCAKATNVSSGSAHTRDSVRCGRSFGHSFGSSDQYPRTIRPTVKSRPLPIMQSDIDTVSRGSPTWKFSMPS